MNVVGTGVRDCAVTDDPLTCYAEPYLVPDLRHGGAPLWVPHYDGQMRALDFPRAHVEGLKALAAEQWLDPVINGWQKPYVNEIARNELRERPFDGVYELELALGPEVRLDRIVRIQILVGSQYWVKQDWEE